MKFNFEAPQQNAMIEMKGFSAMRKSKKTSEEEGLLVAAGHLRLPKTPLNIAELFKISTGKMPSSEGAKALLDDRDEGL